MTDLSAVESIFFRALEKPAGAERAAFLEGACGGDAELRRHVERMLAAHPQAAGFLNAPASGLLVTVDQPRGADAAPLAERPGTLVGPYKLMEQIGEGGMGLVFVAEQQQPVRRRVALKIIKPGMDSRQVIARFEAERQALALMDHQNIAKVYDAATTESGRPYFVMELVHGIPITEYCDANQLTPRQRLELFIPVCQAIQHAHQKGIIHRDIKPSNILVTMYDDRAVPKVIDFGVAKAVEQRLTEKTVYTQFGTLVGTFEYMSPEQAEMNAFGVDTRSDVYSLGVLLYELLTGTTPLERPRLREAAYGEIVRLIKEEEPPRPSIRLSTSGALAKVAAARKTDPAKLSRLVRGELDWVVMKCLEKDRTRRYHSAGSLARDVERFLTDEPIEARPPSAWYRFRKLARRNKVALTTAALVASALVLGSAVSIWQAVRALSAATAEKEANEAAQARQRETEAVLDFVENRIFAAARPEGEEGGLGRDVTIRKAVEAALPFVRDRFADQPLIEARLRMTVGKCLADLGDDKIAVDQLEAARALYVRQLGPDHPDTLRSVCALAWCYVGLDRLEEAVHLLEETWALQKATLGPNHPDTLRSEARLAGGYFRLGRWSDANRLGEETLRLRRATLGPYDRDTLFSMHNLAFQYGTLGRHADAAKLEEETVALIEEKLGPQRTELFKPMWQLAMSYYFLGRQTEGLKLQEKSLSLQKAKWGPDHPETLMATTSLACCYFFVFDRYADAITLCEETVALAKARHGPDHFQTIWSTNKLAWFLATVPDRKLRDPPRALELARKVVGASPKEADYWGTYGVARYRTGDGKGAVEALQKAIVLRNPDDVFIPTDQSFFLAMAHWQLGDKGKARQLFDRSLRWMEKELSEKKGFWPHDAELKRFRAEAAELIGVGQRPSHERAKR